jgi:hypothetical protein
MQDIWKANADKVKQQKQPTDVSSGALHLPALVPTKRAPAEALWQVGRLKGTGIGRTMADRSMVAAKECSARRSVSRVGYAESRDGQGRSQRSNPSPKLHLSTRLSCCYTFAKHELTIWRHSENCIVGDVVPSCCADTSGYRISLFSLDDFRSFWEPSPKNERSLLQHHRYSLTKEQRLLRWEDSAAKG